MATPLYGKAFEFYVSLVDTANRPAFKASPTIATGDFKISKDGGAFANLATLPSVSPAGGIAVKVSLSATEMSANNVFVAGIDAAGGEWDNVVVEIVPDQLVPELTAAPSATSSFEDKMTWIFMRLRNKQTLDRLTGVETIYADNNTTPIATCTDVDDGDVFTKGKMT